MATPKKESSTQEKPRATSRRKPKAEVIQEQVQEKQLPSVPVLRNSSGNEVALTVENIQRIGNDEGSVLSDLSDQILSKVTISNSGELGEGIGQILKLTNDVDLSKLGNKPTGLISRVYNIFNNTQRKILDKFQTSAEQIEQITDVLHEGIERMKGETTWLQEVYFANLEKMRSLENSLQNLEEVLVVEQAKLETIRNSANPDLIEMESQRVLTSAIDKQADKLRHLLHFAKLLAPQITSMRAVNSSTIEKFETAIVFTIPAWKTNMSIGLISQQQAKDNELSKNMDETTARILIANSENASKNMKDAAIAANRGVLSVEDLKKIQNNTLTGIRETISIENQAAKEREKSKAELARMNLELKNELMRISNEKSKGN